MGAIAVCTSVRKGTASWLGAGRAKSSGWGYSRHGTGGGTGGGREGGMPGGQASERARAGRAKRARRVGRVLVSS